jgi:hypothetical protein
VPPIGPPDTQLMVLEIRLPNAWDALSAVWQAVQADLGLPAPAIAVSGIDGYQLWFSIRPALARSEARLFLQGLCHRYLAQLPAERVRMFVDAAWSEPTGAPAGLRGASHGALGGLLVGLRGAGPGGAVRGGAVARHAAQRGRASGPAGTAAAG